MSETESCLAYPCQSCGMAIEFRRFGRRPMYCSARCRTAAFRRSEPPIDHRPTEIAIGIQNSPIEIIEKTDRLWLHDRRIDDKTARPIPPVGRRRLNARAEFRYRKPKAIPDAVYPGMWRVQWPDGRTSDMANLSRINDAISNFLERAA